MPVIKRGAVQVHYDDVGSGPCLILGHSFLCSGEMWRNQIDDLARNHRVLNVDFRGHGGSSRIEHSFSLYDLVDDLVAVLDHAGVEKAVWAGLSVGGMVAMRAALRVPERVSGLVLIDSHSGAERAVKVFKYRAMSLGTRLVGLRPFVPAILPLMFGRSTMRGNATLVGEWKERFAALHPSSIRTFLKALNARDSVTGMLSDLSVPTLVVVGEEDASLPPRCSEVIASAIPGARLEVIPRAGHLSALEQPEAVTRVIGEFLAAFSL